MTIASPFLFLPHRLSQPGFSYSPVGTSCFNLPFEDLYQITLHALQVSQTSAQVHQQIQLSKW